MKSKKIIIISLVIILMLLQSSLFIQNVRANVLGGKTDDNSWTFDTETGTLTFKGTGTIIDNFSTSVQKNNIKHIKIGEGIEKIGEELSVFSECENLEDVEFPESLKEIGYYCFSGCTSLKSIILPKNLERLTWASFAGCTSLTSITLPKSLTDSGANSFVGCSSLKEIIVEQGNTSYMSVDGILYNKDKTELVAYPIGKTEIEFDVPTYVTTLGWGAFCNSTNLEKIVVPNSVTEIQGAVFQDCKKVKVYCKSDSKAKEYAEAQSIEYEIDDNVPTIILEQKEKEIVVTSTDIGVGLSKEAYSLDKENWSSNNKLTVEKSGTYTVYVKDRLENVATKEIVVTIIDKTENDEKISDEKTTDDKDIDKETIEEKKTNEEIKTYDTNKEEKNNENKVTEKATETTKADDTASKKAFGQYGSTPIIISLIIVTSTLGYFCYNKFKKTIIK